MKILAFTKYAYEGPSSRYRFYHYQEAFLKHNITMHIKPLFGTQYFTTTSKWGKALVALLSYVHRFFTIVHILCLPKTYDLVRIEYELFPYFPAWFEFLLGARGVQYIVEYDDAIFHRYDTTSHVLIHTFLGKKIEKVIGYASAVIVCNAYLEAYARLYNADVIKIPTVVPLKRYNDAKKAYCPKKDDAFIIGWIGSLSTSVYVLEILPEMKKFVQTYNNVSFHLLGFDKTLLSDKERQEVHIEVTEWSEEEEIATILAFDIGMMPLPDDAWSRGKCGFKLIQYMACQKPVVASAVGVNCDLVDEPKGGVLVRSQEAWYDAFESLYLDEALRKEMGRYNRHKIEKEYHPVEHTQRYVNLFQTYFKEESIRG